MVSAVIGDSIAIVAVLGSGKYAVGTHVHPYVLWAIASPTFEVSVKERKAGSCNGKIVGMV